MSQPRSDAKNEIKKALAFKRLQEHLAGKKISGLTGETMWINMPCFEMHRLGHSCEDCEKCEECRSTKNSRSNEASAKLAKKALAQRCPECRRIFGEHSDEELMRCIER